MWRSEEKECDDNKQEVDNDILADVLGKVEEILPKEMYSDEYSFIFATRLAYRIVKNNLRD